MAKLPYIPKGIASHPYEVSNLADLPASLRLPAVQALEAHQPVHSIFVVPAQIFLKGWFGQRYVPEQALLFTSSGVLHVQAEVTPDRPVQTTYLRAVDLLYIHLSLILLYGRLELIGEARGGQARIEVEFNTVAESLLQPRLRQLLSQTWDQTQALSIDHSLPPISLRELDRLPMKFSNGLRHRGLQRGEQLLGFVFQPAIWTRHWRFFSRQLTAALVLALTDRQLIILEEDKTGEKGSYGWIFTFCPLASVSGMEMKLSEGRQEWYLHLRRGVTMLDRQITFEPETALIWQDLWSRYSRVREGTKEPAWSII